MPDLAFTDPSAPTARRTPQRLRDREWLLGTLDDVDVQGWDGPAAGALLEEVRLGLVRPAVRSAGLRGAAATQAEATGWAVAWETLRAPGLRDACSPWGVVWQAVRRAVLGEVLSALYGTGPRAAFRIARLYRDAEDSGCGPRGRRAGDWAPPRNPAVLAAPVSLQVLLDAGHDVMDAGPPREQPLGGVLELVVAAMVRAGWAERPARRVLRCVASAVPPSASGRRYAPGWREVAVEAGVPQWQARRVTVLLLGTSGWAGLVERLVRQGPGVLDTAPMRAALRSTLSERVPAPPRAHRLTRDVDERPALRAS